MRLKKVKLSGFKSFVDPTTIPISGDLIGIVGPNGCGKSNVIDAVRWVMGESSAKHLRGDSMSDVIFSGSSTRMPVGKASVELIFDNSNGDAPGQYAAYAEISIRREVVRDGQSDYFLNKTRCRRKDITDIFLGTGLGPRAYSIIEQGMVTRIIEAKPEELRVFFEEAAGISKYKERRRETENRIKHTRENLARVQDIRKELDMQLQRLQRQSKAASKYKELKQRERLLRAQLLSLRWQNLNGRIDTHDGKLSAEETALEGVIAGQRGIEAEIEKIRASQTEAGDHFNGVQAQFYAISAEISAIEQTIQHARDTQQQRLREQQQINQSWQEAELHLRTDKERREQLRQALETLAPRLAALSATRSDAGEDLKQAELAMQAWQSSWEEFAGFTAESAKTLAIQRERIRQLEQQISLLIERRTRLEEEAGAIEQELSEENADAFRQQVGERDRLYETQAQRLEQLEEQSRQTRVQQEEINLQLEELRGRGQQTDARLASLRELQAAALGKHDAGLNAWLKQRTLDSAPRLAGLLSVEPGWEKAVERVLGADLGAVCVANLEQWANDLAELKQSDLVVFDLAAQGGKNRATSRATLHDKIRSQIDLSSLLSGVYIAEGFADAMAMRPDLEAHESVVTRSGVWLGKNWLGVTDEQGARAGIIGREREIEVLSAVLNELQEELRRKQARSAEIQQRQQALEAEIVERRRQFSDYNRERAELHSQLGHKEARLAHRSRRHEQIVLERAELKSHLGANEQELTMANSLLRKAGEQSSAQEQRRAELLQSRDALRSQLEQARQTANAAGEALHRVEVEWQGTQTALDSTQQSIERLEAQLQHLHARRAELENLLTNQERPEAELKHRLEEFLGKRLQVEGRLAEARKATTDLEAALRSQEQARLQQEQKIQQSRELVEQERIVRQELLVRRETLQEQIRESGYEPAQVLQDLPQAASEESCQTELEQLLAKIERLGQINLVAIQEFEEQSQRKAFLDKQYEDLSQALNTLEEAIRKIDRETRTRFRDTFDKVNSGFQTFFPRLFGGGQAHLELVGEDLLDTGVTVMARPPGKRNSTIHLLSGGEKALTAVALLFAIFELNPAPFCLLDEVDAPLDDANVERYSETLKAMSQRTQLIYITHNKISMEMAQVLLGVTMSEPGVSRLVAVDVDEAIELASQNQKSGTPSSVQAGTQKAGA
jgi:chromosome segregation protein